MKAAASYAAGCYRSHRQTASPLTGRPGYRQICRKSDGLGSETKLEAPDIVQPRTGRSISESLAVMDGNKERFGGLQPPFEGVDDTGHKFPHPYFGEMTATEWFAVKIAHEARHTRQIATLIEKIR